MSSKITLRQLIDFEPETDGEKELYSKYAFVISDIKFKLQQGLYYLGGQIKMVLEDEINLELFDKVREIDRKREAEYGGPCNSFEQASIYRHKKALEDTENLFKLYIELINSREN